MDAFGPALAGADHIVLTDIYAAGEEPIPGVTLDALAAAVRRSVTAPVDVVPRARRRRRRRSCGWRRPGDVVITLGAGSIGTVADRLDRAASEALTRERRSPPRPIAVSGARTSSRRAESGAGARWRRAGWFATA